MSDRRSEILVCARDLFLEEGLRGLTMRKVAERAGITPMAIYRHLEDKEDLLTQVTAEGFTIFGQYLYRALENGETPLERLLLSGESFIDFALEQTGYYELIFMTHNQLWNDGVPETVKRAGNPTRQFLTDRVRECMADGTLRIGDPERVAVVIWAQSHGVVSLYLSGRIEADAEEIRELFRDAHQQLFQGIVVDTSGAVEYTTLTSGENRKYKAV